MPVSNCLLTRIFSYIIVSFLVHTVSAQTLIINEVSNGSSGNQEYVELVVIDSTVIYDCTTQVPPCIDIRGWIFDDNSGYHGPFGVATGSVRFSFDPLWACVPLGTIIVIYNSADPNPSLPPDDISLSDGNCSLVVPISSSLFEQNSTTPGAVACSYPSTGWTPGGSWSNTVFANGGDCARIVDLSGCEVFSVCWSDASQNNLIYFASGSTGSDNVWYFNDGDPYSQINWTEGCADLSTCGSNSQTPGVPNNALNASYISQFNNNCQPITPVIVTATSTDVTGCTCDGTGTASASGSIPGYSYVWYDSTFSSPGITSANATGLCAGTYHVIATSSIGCSDTSTIVVNPSPSVPVVIVPDDTVVCSGGTIAATNFISSPPGATFAWTNSDSSIGLASSGSGNISSFAAMNNGTGPVTATISVTATLAGCTGPPSDYAIIVNPIPVATAPASVVACAGDTIPSQNFTANIAGVNFSWINSDPSIGLAATGSGNTPSFEASNPGSSSLSSTISVTPELNNCSGSPVSYLITVEPLPVTDPVADIIICHDDSLSSILFTSSIPGTVFTWTNTDTTIGLSSSGTGDLPGFNASGNSGSSLVSTVGVAASANGCAGPLESFTITVLPLPAVLFLPDISACQGEIVASTSFASSPAGANFSWTNSNTLTGLPSSGTGDQPPFTASNTGAVQTSTITVTPTLNGCEGLPESYNITINTAFNSTINPAGPFCANDPPFTLSTADPGGSWSGNGITDTVNGTFDPSIATQGIHAVSYSIPGTCGSSDTILLTVNTLPVIITSPDTICEGGSTTLSATGASSYTWSPGSGLSSVNGSSVTAGPLTTTTYLITGTDTNGCSGTANVTVTVNVPYDATISPAGPFCASAPPVNLSAADPGGIWSGPGITDSATGSFDPSAAGPGSHSIVYSINQTCGDTSAIFIDVIADADATILATGPYCFSSPADTLSSLEPGGVWSGTGITDSITGIFDPGVSGAGDFTITYNIPGSCGDLQSVILSVTDSANASIIPVNPFCSEDNAVNLASAEPGGTWSGTGITNATLGTFDPSVAGAGSHTIYYMISGACGDTGSVIIDVYQQSDAGINPAGPFCILDNSFTLSPFTSGGTWSGNGITDPANGIFSPQIAGTGTHTITYSLSGVCGDSQSINITVSPQTDASINSAGPFCENNLPFVLTAINPGGIWSGSGINNSTGEFSPSVAGSGTHTITYISPGNCPDTSSQQIQVYGLPAVSFEADNTSGCAPLNVIFSSPGLSPGSYVQWDFGDGTSSNDSTVVSSEFTSPGCYDITLSVTSAEGCINSSTAADLVCVADQPSAEFIFSPSSPGIFDQEIVFTNLSEGAVSYYWSFAGSEFSNEINPVYFLPEQVQDTFVVCLNAYNTSGCMDSICRDIIISNEFLLYLPNGFTPDNDGINDEFIPVISGHDPEEFEFMIFNRWGELIFFSESVDEGWNGSYKGVISKQDVYVWKIKAKDNRSGERKVYTGHVTLLR